jgi:DNA polymerase-3 subunit epsilon
VFEAEPPCRSNGKGCRVREFILRARAASGHWRCPLAGPHQCSEDCDPELLPQFSALTSRTLRQAVWDIREVGYSLEQMAHSLVESGDYRVTSRLEPQAEYHPPDDSPKLVAAVVDVETTGTNPDCDRIIELGICLFEYDRQSGRIYKVLGSWEWFEDPGCSIPPEITKITGITDEMIAGHRIDDRAVNDLLCRVVLVIAHNADFDRRFLEKRLPAFATKHWACSRADIDWKAEGIRSSALEFVAYSLGFLHDGHRAASDCRATLHVLAQPFPGTGRLVLQALWNTRDCRHGGYGQETPQSRRRIS